MSVHQTRLFKTQISILIMKCKHFTICGGCSYLDVPYKEQLKGKEERLKEILEMDIKVNPAPNPLRYRNRMDLVFAFGKAGMRKKGTYKDAFNLEECYLISEKAQKLFLLAKDVCRKHEISDYNYLKHRGYLRYIVVREAQNTGQVMLIFVTATQDPLIEKVIKDLEKSDVHSLVWSVNETRSDTSFGEVKKTWKSETITERLGNLSFEIGPNSFFQSNSKVAEKVYSELKEFVEGKTLDLFCGVGGIALFVADKTSGIVGVDSVEESIQFANKNAKTNKIKAKFIQNDAKRFLIECNERNESFDTVICDPPRDGLNPKTIKHLKKLSPKRIIMVSCNPKTLAQNLSSLDNYKIIHKKGFDMFPQTPHVEVLVVLDRNI